MKQLTLELGASRAWRQYRGGHYERTIGFAGRSTLKHVPRVHHIKVDDATAAGLIQSSKDWEAASAKGEPRPGEEPHGIEPRMLRVSEVKDAGPDPEKSAPPIQALLQGITASLEKVVKSVAAAR